MLMTEQEKHSMPTKFELRARRMDIESSPPNLRLIHFSTSMYPMSAPQIDLYLLFIPYQLQLGTYKLQ